MEISDTAPSTATPATAPVSETAGGLRRRWAAQRDQLLRLSTYADTLIEAARLVDAACDEAETTAAAAKRDAETTVASAKREADAAIAAAHREAESIRAGALDAAEALTRDARQDLASLRLEIQRLEAERVSAQAALAAARASERPAAGEPGRGREEAGERGGGEPRYTDVLGLSTTDPAEGVAERQDETDPRPGRRAWRRAMVGVVALGLFAAVAWWRLPAGPSTDVARVATPLPPPATASPAIPSSSAIAAPREPAPSPPPEPAPGVSVAIRAARAAWIRTGVDGVFERGGFIAAGKERVLTGDREVEVRTADGGALLVSVNGAPEMPLGRNGATVTKRWASDGPARPQAQEAKTPPAIDAPTARASETSVATGGVARRPADPAPSLRDQIADADRRWFEARYRNEERALGGLQAPEFELADLRARAARPSAGVPVERHVRTFLVETWGDHAAASGVMIERTLGTEAREFTSVFAETWVRRDGRWQLMGVRLNTPGQDVSR